MTPEDLYEIIKDEPNKLNLLLGTLNLLKKMRVLNKIY